MRRLAFSIQPMVSRFRRSVGAAAHRGGFRMSGLGAATTVCISEAGVCNLVAGESSKVQQRWWVWVWVATQPFYVSRSSRAKLAPLARSWSQGEKISKNLLSLPCASVWAIRRTGAFSSAHPSHPIPPRAGIWGFGVWPLTRSRRSRGLACSRGSQQEKKGWSIRIRPARCVPLPPPLGREGHGIGWY